MTTTTPGRRLHAALLAHGIISGSWERSAPNHRFFEAAAREYDGDCGCPSCTPLTVEDVGEDVLTLQTQILDSRTRDIALSDRLDALSAEVATLRREQASGVLAWHREEIDALTAEVAALRRDRDADIHAMGVVGNRLAKIERDLADLEPTISDIYRQLDRLERWRAGTIRRAIDGGDPLRRTEPVCPKCNGTRWATEEWREDGIARGEVSYVSGPCWACTRKDEAAQRAFLGKEETS